jgi:hypothetical protein
MGLGMEILEQGWVRQGVGLAMRVLVKGWVTWEGAKAAEEEAEVACSHQATTI